MTLKRVLGSDLERLDWMAKLVHYPSETWPEYLNQRSYVSRWGEGQRRLSKLVGCRLAHRIYTSNPSTWFFARRVARRLLREEPGLGKDRLLVCPQGMISLMVLDELSKGRKLDYVTWIMDDHVVRWKDGEWVYPGKLEQSMKRHLEGAHCVYTISHAMADFYRKRFGIEAEVLCGPGQTASPEPVTTKQRERTGPLRIAYFGSLGPWQNDALELLAGPVAEGRVALDLFTRDRGSLPETLFKAGCGFPDPVAPEQVQETASGYDAVVLPISFRAEMRNMSEFNYATKFAEYLAVPVPTLLIGPPYAAMVNCARKADACVIVDEASEAAIATALNRLADPCECSAVIAAEAKLLREEFSVEVMRRRWNPAREFLFSEKAK